MPASDYVIIVNTYTSGPTGHVNITYSHDETAVTYGNNLAPETGVQREDSKLENAPPGTLTTKSIPVTEAQFNNSLMYTQAMDALTTSYLGLGNNCVDYANEALKYAGKADWAITDYLPDGTLVDAYAKYAAYLSGSIYVDLATSSLINVLMSASDMNDAKAFVENMSWLADHGNGSDFYQNPENYDYFNYQDPDSEAAYRANLLKHYADKLGIKVWWDPINEKVMLGVASPIVLDLNGDGIQSTSYLANTVLFDINGDGVKDRTAWINGQDGFLAIDRNGNGSVDDVHELFGGLTRGEGFAQLAEFDSNGDSVVDANDEHFSSLQIWQDANINGFTDAGELRSAATAGLTSIAVTYQSQDEYQNGNLIGEMSSATLNGQSVEAADIYFKFQDGTSSSIELDPESSNQATMADSLIQAMAGFSPSNASSIDLRAGFHRTAEYAALAVPH